MTTKRTRVVVLGTWLMSVAAGAQAQSSVAGASQSSDAPDPMPAWSFRAAAATYIFPTDGNYVQPTLTADRGGLHLEARYKYEDPHSVSGFVGWNVEFGKTVTFQMTPMFGVVVGDTDGVIPALELDLAWRRFELYSEGELVINVDDHESSFLYNWSEASLWATSWLRVGVATQRTRAYHTARDIQRGPLIGVTLSRIEGAVYLFNPGSDDHYIVASIALKF